MKQAKNVQNIIKMALVIIGIHGLGNKPDKDTLKEWWQLSMLEGLENNGFKNDLPEFELVYWADIIHEKPLNKNIKDPDSPYYIDEVYKPSPENFAPAEKKLHKKLFRFLGNQLNKIFLNEDYTLKYSFLADYIVRKYFKSLEIYYKEECTTEEEKDCKVKEMIKQRLSNVLKKHKNDEIMLISHSMGSIIAYDVLSFFSPNVKIHSFVTIGSPLGLPLIVSKIAAQYKKNTKGKNEMITPYGVYGKWCNLYDILDRIVLNHKLALRYKSNYHSVEPEDFEVINDYHNQENEHNPHKSYGYLRTRELAGILNDFITK